MNDTDNEAEKPADYSQPQPGMIVAPGAVPEPASEAKPPPAIQAPEQSNDPIATDTPSINSGESAAKKTVADALINTITWDDPEFVAHDKSPFWYVKLFGITGVLAVLLYLPTKDILSVVVLIVAAISLAIYGQRRPKNIVYNIGEKGMSIGPKQFNYDQFRCFTTATEGKYISFTFLPLKRFSPPVGICYSGHEEEAITNLLSERLPFEQRRPDFIDGLMLRIHF